MEIEIKVIVEKVLDAIWGSPEELEELSNEEIIELTKEDLIEFLEGAHFEVKRIWKFSTKRKEKQ